METKMTAVEMTGTVDEHHCLHLDETLPIPGPRRVRVIILYPLSEEGEESEWVQAAAHSPAFSYLSDTQADIYTLADGKPFDEQV